jgi:lupus La protein
MKIKEKGLTGKAATTRKASMATRPRGFNAFQEMFKGNKDKGGKDKSKPEIWLEFMGTKLRVHEENGGSVKSENVPYVKGATLKFTGCGGDVSFRDIKVCLLSLLTHIQVMIRLFAATDAKSFHPSSIH